MPHRRPGFRGTHYGCQNRLVASAASDAELASYATMSPETKLAWKAYLNARSVKALSPDRLQDLPQPSASTDFSVSPWVFVAIAVIAVLVFFFGPQSNKVPPKGRVPRLSTWLERAPPRPPRVVRADGSPVPQTRDLSKLSFEPVTSVGGLWEVFGFTSKRLVEEVPSVVQTSALMADSFSRLALFPSVALEWNRYEGCAVDEVTLGPSSSTLSFGASSTDDAPTLVDRRRGNSELDIVSQCSELIDDFGLSVVARRPDEPIAGVAVLRVKRLPSECHVEEYEDGTNEVVCVVDYDAAYEAPGLEAVAYLEMIAVDKDWRGSGLANSLLEWVEEKGRTWGLSVMALHVHRDNWGALRFYERNGYESTSDWIGLGPDFFLLVKPL